MLQPPAPVSSSRPFSGFFVSSSCSVPALVSPSILSAAATSRRSDLFASRFTSHRRPGALVRRLINPSSLVSSSRLFSRSSALSESAAVDAIPEQEAVGRPIHPSSALSSSRLFSQLRRSDSSFNRFRVDSFYCQHRIVQPPILQLPWFVSILLSGPSIRIWTK
ncbi:hypothetical protein LINPERHAP2_LOCUS24488 [Linum perenne]